MSDTSNTRKAVMEFYLESHYYSVAAKATFPAFYRKFLKWLGEIPGEIEGKKVNLWIARIPIPEKTDSIYLLIPLKNRVLIFEWGSGDGDPHNQVYLGPLELMNKEGQIDIGWLRKNRNEVKFFSNPSSWEEEIWNC